MPTSVRPTALALAAGLLPALATPAGAVPNLLDLAFGDRGSVITAVGTYPDGAHGLVVDAAGRFVVAGGSQNGVVIVRHLADGTLDPGFGAGGIVNSPLVGVARAVTVDAAGRIVAAGTSCSGVGCQLLLARYLADGSPDPAFGADGVVLAVGRGFFELANDVAIDAGGRIVVAGFSDDRHVDPVRSLLVARFLDDGTPDPSFGAQGFLVSASGLGSASALALQPGGRIVVGAQSGPSGDIRLTVVRLLDDGAPDPTFGSGGTAVLQIAPGSYASDVALLADGRILVTGSACNAGSLGGCGFALLRLAPDGSLDPTFATAGVARTDPGLTVGIGSQGLALALAPDGAIVVAGRASVGPSFASSAAGVARYTPDGALDATFGGGVVTSRRALDAQAVAVLADGRIVTAGAAASPVGFALLRFAPCACGPCDTCDGGGGCVPAPASACHAVGDGNASRFRVERGRGDVRWSWESAAPVSRLALGRPAEVNDFALCVYDDSVPGARVLARAAIPAAGTCGTRPCWSQQAPFGASAESATYRDSAGTPDGVTRLEVVSGDAGHARVGLKARRLAFDPLVGGAPLPVPLRVQLQAENGECWEARYTMPRRNDPARFVAPAE